MTHTDDMPGLSPPDAGPPGRTEYKARERDEDRLTRKPLSGWDRVKWMVLLGALWLFFAWARMDEHPLRSFNDAARDVLASKWWILALLGVEALRQTHYLVSEHSARWHQFWSTRVFGGLEKRTGKINDWNRYRLSRLFKWLLALFVLMLILAEIYDLPPARALLKLPTALWDAMPFVIQIVFIMFIAVGQFVAIFWFLSRGGTEVYMPDDIKTRFSDVWGQDSVLERVKENMVFLEDPESIEEKGGYVPGGILLWGPPGTGKTLMAEAVAGETGKPYVFVEPSAFINMFIGVGPMKVKALFRKLRKLALRYGGVIVFFDEADSLGNRGMATGVGPAGAVPAPWDVRAQCHGMAYARPETTALLMQDSLRPADGGEPRPGGLRRIFVGAGMNGGGGMGTLQVLLTELSGLKKPRGFFNRVVRRALGMRPKPPPKYRILVMMATNMPQALDEALLRPGRIDRIYKVGYPSKVGRIRTYEGYLDKVKHELTAEDIDKLATVTPYATGATIKDLVNEALVVAIRDGRDSITWKDIVKAKLLKSLGPPQDVEYIERERHAIAVHEACHAVAQYRLQKHQGIDIATIEMGQSYLGMVKPIPLEEMFTSWKSEYDCEIMVFLASLAGERMFFENDNSSGVRADLEAATSIAMYMEGYWGMGRTVGSHAAVKGPSGGGYELIDGVSRNMLESGLGVRVEERLEELYERVRRLLEANRREVLAVAHALETHKTITGDDIAAIIEGHPGPLVDGTPYISRDFVELAESYHVRAVAAHNEKGKVDIPLPVLNGQKALPLGKLAALDAGEHEGNGSTDDILPVPDVVELEEIAGRRRRRRPPPEPTGNGKGEPDGEEPG